VNDIVGKLQKPGYASDSSSLGDDDGDYHWELLEDDRARARAPEPGEGGGKEKVRR
jgi:hypothetical protein